MAKSRVNEKDPKRKLQKLCSYFVKANNCNFSKDVLFNYLFDSEGFTKLCKSWEESDYNTAAAPGIFVINNEFKDKFNLSDITVKTVQECKQQKKERTKKTNIKKYGVEFGLQSSKIREKGKNTCLKRYGTKFVSQSSEWKSKVRESMLGKYGVTSPNQIPEIKEKIRKTNLERYGVEKPLQNSDILTKQQETMVSTYGVKNAGQHKKMKERAVKAMIETKIKTGYYRILPTNETVQQMADRLGYNYSTCCSLIKEYGYEKAEEYLSSGKKVSSLETRSEKILNLTKPLGGIYLDNKYRPDFKLSSNLYLDVDGLFWHCELNQENPYYHYEKRSWYEDNGYRLLQFREDEINKKPDIVKSMIDASWGRSIKTFNGRSCKIVDVPKASAKNFCNLHHLQGFHTGGKFRVGLVDSSTGELLQLMIVGSAVTGKKSEVFIDRFCTKIGCRVRGGFNKLLNRTLELLRGQNYSSLISFCDLRYSQGGVYEQAGFKAVSEDISFCWTDFKETFHRLKFKKIKEGHDKGYYRLFDAGQRKYELLLG